MTEDVEDAEDVEDVEDNAAAETHWRGRQHLHDTRDFGGGICRAEGETDGFEVPDLRKGGSLPHRLSESGLWRTMVFFTLRPPSSFLIQAGFRRQSSTAYTVAVSCSRS